MKPSDREEEGDPEGKSEYERKIDQSRKRQAEIENWNERQRQVTER